MYSGNSDQYKFASTFDCIFVNLANFNVIGGSTLFKHWCLSFSLMQKKTLINFANDDFGHFI